MEKKTEILGIKFDFVDFEQAKKRAFSFLEEKNDKTIYTPNPEMVMLAQKNSDFARVLNCGDLVVPDGIGIVYASKLNKNRLKERVAGYDLVREILSEAAKKGKRVFFLGGAKGVAEAAKKRTQADFAGLCVVGTCDGYFSDEDAVVSLIKETKTDILLVGLGFPKQEFFIDKYRQKLGAKILIGCGGTLDALAGRTKRAPKIFIRLGLEWLYRLIKQPSRLKRQLAIPRFMAAVIKEKVVNGRMDKKVHKKT